jgi:ribosomal protein L37E
MWSVRLIQTIIGPGTNLAHRVSTRSLKRLPAHADSPGVSQSSVPPPSAPPTAHAIPTDTCEACGQAVDFRASSCPRCGFPRGMGLPSLGSATKAKSPRGAMWLSLTWPGSGHVYAGITEKGAILCGISAVLFALSLTLIGPVLGLLLWLGLSLYTAIDVSSTLTS